MLNALYINKYSICALFVVLSCRTFLSFPDWGRGWNLPSATSEVKCRGRRRLRRRRRKTRLRYEPSQGIQCRSSGWELHRESYFIHALLLLFSYDFEGSSAAQAGQANWQKSYKDWKVFFFFHTPQLTYKDFFFIFEQTFTTLWERKSCRPLRMSMSTWAETLETSMALPWRWQEFRFEKKENTLCI